MAGDHASTDWAAVVGLYDDLLVLQPSPAVVLNRAVALAMAEGPAAGIAAIERVAGGPFALVKGVP